MADDLSWWDPNAPAMTPKERKARLHPVAGKKHGHAAMPGTGPPGQSCGTCGHLYRNRMAKTYLKCGLMRRFWTGGGGTDVLARDPACSRWEAPKSAEGDKDDDDSTKADG